MIEIVYPICCPMPVAVSEDLKQVIQVNLPRTDGGGATKFLRTPYAAMPQSVQVCDAKVLAHYREMVPENARHLLALSNQCFLIPFVDECNPDLGNVSGYQKKDVENPCVARWMSNGANPYQGNATPVSMPTGASVSGVGQTSEEVPIPMEGLAWGKSAPSPEFLAKVIEIADEVDTNPSWLLTQFWGESRFNPQANLTNGVSSGDAARIGPKTIGGGLFGLMKQWAKKALGIDFYDFMKMTALEQLEVARKFYAGGKGKLRSMNDVFMYTFWPAALGRKDSFVLMRRGDGVYEQNKQMDTTGDGVITKGEAARIRYNLYKEGMRDQNRLDRWEDLPVKTSGVIGAPFATERGQWTQTARVLGTQVGAPFATERGQWTQTARVLGASSSLSRVSEAKDPLEPPKRDRSTWKVDPIEGLAYVQRVLTEQAILTLVRDALEYDAETYGLSSSEEDLLEEVDGQILDDAEIERLRKAEKFSLKPSASFAKAYLDRLAAKEHEVQTREGSPYLLAEMALSELRTLQQEALSSAKKLVEVGFSEETVDDLIEDWIVGLGEVFGIEDLERPHAEEEEEETSFAECSEEADA